MQARQFEEQGNREAAGSCYSSALAGLPARDLTGRLEASFGLARLARERGAFEEALSYLQRALPEAEADRGVDTEPAADVLAQLGWVEFYLGRFADAERDLQRAQAIYERVGGPYQIKVTQVLDHLGAVYRERSDYDRSERALAQALANLDRPGADDPSVRAEIYSNLAGGAYYRNDYRRAIELLRKVGALYEKLYGESGPKVAALAHNLGDLYKEIGECELARAQLERALRLHTALGAHGGYVGATLVDLGALEAGCGDEDRALAYFAQAEKELSRSLGREHPRVADNLENWALLLEKRGDVRDAAPLLERALAIWTKAKGADSDSVAQTLTNLARVWSKLGVHRNEAADAARRALAIAATGGEPDVEWRGYHAHALLLARTGRLRAAALYGKYAVNILQRMRTGLTSLGGRVPASFVQQGGRESAYRDLADALISLGRITEAEQVVAMLKDEEFFGFTGLGSVRAGGSIPVGFSGSEAREAERLDAAVAELRASAHPEHPESTGRAGRPAGDARYRTERVRFDAVLRSVDVALEHVTPGRASASPLMRSNMILEPGTAVLTYVITADRIQVIEQVGGSVDTRLLAITEASLNKMVFEFRQLLQDPRSDPLPLAQQLYRALIQPVQISLSGSNVESLELVLDGALRYLPFGALHDGRGFLVERYRTALRTSLTLASRPAVSPAQERLAGFGVTRAVGGFSALPRVREELDNIVLSDRADSHGFIPGLVALDDDFTLGRLKGVLDERYPLVHIASHFVVRPGTLSRSYLLLGDGSRLTLEQLKGDVLSFRDLRLLTLSACSTAVGEPDATGAEFESFGVLAGRLGARQVLATLWSVPDSSTSALMASFYRLRQQRGETVAALTEAQRAMLDAGERHGPYSHPYYWAPFVVFLNDRSS